MDGRDSRMSFFEHLVPSASQLVLLAMLLTALVPAQTGVAYVIGEGNDLTRVDLENGNQSVLVPGLGHPQGMAVDGPRGCAYVVETVTGELTKVDLATGALTLIGGGLVNPRQIRLRPTSGNSPPASAYVLERPENGQPSSISEFDITTGVRLRVVVSVSQDLISQGAVDFTDFALVGDGSLAYATGSTMGLFAINLASGVASVIPIFGLANGMELLFGPIAVNASGTRAYVASPIPFDPAGIWVVDLVANVMAPLVVRDYDYPVMGLTLSADQATLFYADFGSRIWAVDASAPLPSAPLWSLPTPVPVVAGPVNPANAYSGLGIRAGELFFTHEGVVSGALVLACDLSSGSVRVVTNDVLDRPIAIAVSPTTATGYVLDSPQFASQENRLVEVDLVTGTISTVVSGLQNASALTLSPAGTEAYVSEQTAGDIRVSRVDLATGGVSTVFSLPRSPSGPPRIIALDMRSTGALLALNVGEFFEVDVPTSAVTVRAPLQLGYFRHLDAVAARDAAYVSYWQSPSPGSPPALLRVDLGTGAVQPVSGGPVLAQLVRGMRGLRVSPDESFALFADVTGPANDEGRLVKYDFGTGTASVVASTASIPTGFDVLNTADGTSVQAVPVDSASGASPVTLSFAEVTAPGETTLTISASGPTVPAGFQLGSPATFYDVSTTSAFAGPVEICIAYAGVAFGDESTLQLLHYENGNWVNVTTSRNPDGDRICGVVSSFSPFVVVEFPAMGMLTDLMTRVENLDVRHGIIVSLDAKLDAAEQALANVLVGNLGAAVNALQAFICAVNAQSGNQIPSETANVLVADAQAIIASLN